MPEVVIQTILKIGFYSALSIWLVLAVFIIRQISKHDYRGLKISALYLFNSLTFILAWGFILELALIVMAPITDTKEKSIEALQLQANNYLTKFIFVSLATTLVLTITNVLYLKYFVKTKVSQHTIILLVFSFTILLTASYISTEWYYWGLLVEIERHF